VEEEAANRVDWAIDLALASLAADPRDDLSRTVIPPEVLRDALAPEMQAWYDGLLAKVRAVEPEQYLVNEWENDLFIGEVAPVYAFFHDHPELRYADFDLTDDVNAYEIKYRLPSAPYAFTDDLDAVRAEVIPFLAVADRIVDRMPSEASTYDKYRYLAYVLSLITDYADDSVTETGDYIESDAPVTTSYGALFNHEVTCAGYAETFLMLCHTAGLWCQTVTGEVFEAGSTNHQWNLVQLDSGTYFVDVTWSDNSGSIGDDNWMRYFMMDQATTLLDHVPWEAEATGLAEALVRP